MEHTVAHRRSQDTAGAPSMKSELEERLRLRLTQFMHAFHCRTCVIQADLYITPAAKSEWPFQQKSREKDSNFLDFCSVL